MTDLETQVEALMQTLKVYSTKSSERDAVRAILTTLVQSQLNAERGLEIRDEQIIDYCERAEAAEARLAAVEQEREALTAIVEDFALRDFTVGRYSHGERVNVPQPDGSFRRYVKADIDAALTQSRRDHL